MDGPAGDPREESIGDLMGRLADDARAYGQAELALLRQIARHRAAKARTGLILLVAGGLVLLCALIALMFGLVLGLAALIGPLGAGLAIAALLGGLGYGLIRYGAEGMRALAGDEEERAAIRRGETLP